MNTGKPPGIVAARIADHHGTVESVRMLKDGRSYFIRVEHSKPGSRPPLGGKMGPAIGKTELFLDEWDEPTVTTYCRRGKHDVTVSVAELQDAVRQFRGGAAPRRVVTS